MEILPITIQIISLLGACLFMIYLFRLIIRGKLREEYAIIWIVCLIILVVFSIWRSGLKHIANLLGVYYPPSLIFLLAIFAIIVFLVHLSVVNSRHYHQIKSLAQEIALLKKQLEATTHPQEEHRNADLATTTEP